MNEELLDRYAELIVSFGANVQPDQVVAVDGDAYAAPIGDPADLPRINVSKSHTDFMIGSDDVIVRGVTRAGDELPLLVGGAWQI
ncbi:MAG: hypothetical protein ACXVQZ_00260 [Gaiellaceae bacterium]